jgi:hypothetical protein
MTNKQIYTSIADVNAAVSDRISGKTYKDDAEEKLLFYISQELFMAITHKIY